MIPINKREAEQLRRVLPDAHIVRTMKQRSKRGHYFCEEMPAVLSFIRELRGRSGNTVMFEGGRD